MLPVYSIYINESPQPDTMTEDEIKANNRYDELIGCVYDENSRLCGATITFMTDDEITDEYTPLETDNVLSKIDMYENYIEEFEPTPDELGEW